MRRCVLFRPFGLVLPVFAISASLLFAGAALPGALVACSAAAQAQTDVDPLAPKKGELAVVGKVLAVISKENRLALSVTQVTTPDGATVDLHPPVSKSIVLAPNTSYRLLSDASQKVRLADIRPNAILRIVGVTKGAGSPLTARIIAIEADANFDQQSLWLTMPPTQENSWWLFRAKDPAEAHTFIEDKAFKVTVVRPAAMATDVQVIQGGLKMQNGQKWHLHFRAKADPARRVKLSAIVRGGDFHGIGLREEIQLKPEWGDYDFTFTASKVSEEGENSFPSLSFGDKVGTLWITGMRVEEVKGDAKDAPKEDAKPAPK